MGWYFVTPPLAPGTRLLEEEVHHLLRVARIRKGERIGVLDGAGRRGEAIFTGGDELELLSWEEVPPPSLSLIVALGDPRALEQALEGVGELGVREIHLVMSERSHSTGKKLLRLSRWERILRAGARISGNPWLPLLIPPVPWEEKREELASQPLWLLDPHAPTRFPALGLPEPLYLALGPEGGWSSREREGLPCFSLFPPVLSQPLAILAAVTLFHYLKALPAPA